MQVPVQITLRDIPHSESIKEHVHELSSKLQHFFQNIISCHVVIELSNKNQHTGNLYNTRITLAIPGKELISTQNDNENMYLSIKCGFDDLTRQIKEYTGQLKGQIKNHQSILSGKITRLFKNDNFGFIESADGAEFYFNDSHLISTPFDKLMVGMPVHFTEFTGQEGLQARRVKVLEHAEGGSN